MTPSNRKSAPISEVNLWTGEGLVHSFGSSIQSATGPSSQSQISFRFVVPSPEAVTVSVVHKPLECEHLLLECFDCLLDGRPLRPPSYEGS